MIIGGSSFHCHYVVHGGFSSERFITRRISVFTIANVHCVSDLATVCASFPSIVALVPSVISCRYPMLFIANAFYMTNTSAEVADGFRRVDGGIFGPVLPNNCLSC